MGYLFTNYNKKLHNFKMVRNNNKSIYTFNIYNENEINEFMNNLLKKNMFQMIYKKNYNFLTIK